MTGTQGIGYASLSAQDSVIISDDGGLGMYPPLTQNYSFIDEPSNLNNSPTLVQSSTTIAEWDDTLLRQYNYIQVYISARNDNIYNVLGGTGFKSIFCEKAYTLNNADTLLGQPGSNWMVTFASPLVVAPPRFLTNINNVLDCYEGFTDANTGIYMTSPLANTSIELRIIGYYRGITANIQVNLL